MQIVTPPTELMASALRSCRRHFLAVAAFSAVLNLLFLVPMLYILQVYDRVMPTRGAATLFFLTLVLLFGLVSLSLLDFVRSRLLVRASIRLDRELAGVLLDTSLARRDRTFDAVARQAMREFVGIDLAREQVPDATTLLKFRRLLERHELTKAIFEEVNAHLNERGLLMREGTMVDATIIAAPSSTKNKDGKRDPEMHQTKKGNEWHFGMKAHIGADADSGLVHSLHTTPANESDVAHAHELLHGEERRVHADAGYAGIDKRNEITTAQEEARIGKGITWFVAAKRGTIKAMADGFLKELTIAVERTNHG